VPACTLAEGVAAALSPAETADRMKERLADLDSRSTEFFCIKMGKFVRAREASVKGSPYNAGRPYGE